MGLLLCCMTDDACITGDAYLVDEPGHIVHAIILICNLDHWTADFYFYFCFVYVSYMLSLFFYLRNDFLVNLHEVDVFPMDVATFLIGFGTFHFFPISLKN